MVRRRPRPEEPHDHLLDRIERAKADLVEAVPSPRGVPRRPLAEALAAFEEGIREAAALADPPAPLRTAIDESLRRAERLRLGAPSLDYERLVAVLAELMEPLEALDA